MSEGLQEGGGVGGGVVGGGEGGGRLKLCCVSLLTTLCIKTNTPCILVGVN